MDVDKRPVLRGLTALVAVAVVVGLVAGVAAILGSRMLGLGESTSVEGGGNQPAAGETLYLPEPSKTEEPSDPLVTLPGGEESEETGESGESGESEEPGEEESEKPDKKKKVISLSAGQTTATTMDRIDLTGTYPGGEGAVLQVQRRENGQWNDFPVTMSVSNQTFTTYVQTSQSGVNKFRVIDTDTDKTSNPVSVTIG